MCVMWIGPISGEFHVGHGQQCSGHSGQLSQKLLWVFALLQILYGIKVTIALPDNKDQFPSVGHCHAILESTQVLLVH